MSRVSEDAVHRALERFTADKSESPIKAMRAVLTAILPMLTAQVGLVEVSDHQLAQGGVPSKYWDEARKAYALAAAPQHEVAK